MSFLTHFIDTKSMLIDHFSLDFTEKMEKPQSNNLHERIRRYSRRHSSFFEGVRKGEAAVMAKVGILDKYLSRDTLSGIK